MAILLKLVLAKIKEGALSQKGGASPFEGGYTNPKGDAEPCYDALAEALYFV